MSGFFLWIVQHFPFSYQISDFVSRRFNLPMIPDIRITDFIGSFSALLVGAVIYAALDLLVKVLADKIFPKEEAIRPYGIMEGEKEGTLYSGMAFRSKLIEQLFGTFARKSVITVLFRMFIGLIAAFGCGLLGDIICAPIVDHIKAHVFIHGGSVYVYSFLIFLILLLIFSLAYGFLIWLKRKSYNLRDITNYELTSGNKSYPIFRFLILNVLPDILSICITHFWAILAYMLFDAGNTGLALMAIGLMILGYVLSYYIKNLMEWRIDNYFKAYSWRYSLSNLFTFFEEFSIIMIIYVALYNNRNLAQTGDSFERIIYSFPLVRCFREGLSFNSYINQVGESVFFREILALIVFCVFFFAVNRLITRLFSAARLGGGIGLTLGLWWLKVSVLLVGSVLVSYGVTNILCNLDTIPAIVIGILTMLLILFFCPPLLQHVVFVILAVLGMTFVSEATGFLSTAFFEADAGDIRYIITALLMIVIGAGFALIHILTWPSRIEKALTVVPNRLPIRK